MKYKRISADCHLDLGWLPSELFVSEASSALKDRMPYVVDSPDGPAWTTKRGAHLGLTKAVGVVGRKYRKGAQHRFDVMAQTGIYEDGARGINRVGDPHLRIKDMERDGVDAEVIYGVLAVATTIDDDEAASEMMGIYNTWLKDFCSHYPDRHIGLACIPTYSVEAAVKEVYRVAKLGLKGMEISTQWDSKPTWDPYWEPLWKAVSEVDLPIHFHAFPVMARGVLENAGARRPNATFVASAMFQVNLYNILAGMIGGTVLERYPNIRVAFAESGIGWIPYALDRMDFLWEDQESFRNMGLKLKPSEYWRRQCRGSFQYERVGSKMVHLIGAETLMWGSDFPHGDGVWPESDKYIKEQFDYLPAEQVRMITCDNAAKFYRLPVQA